MSLATRHPVITHFVKVLESFAPLVLAEHSWDNVGLLLESPSINVIDDSGDNDKGKSIRVLLTIDTTEAVFQEAIAKQASIILSYHPPWFRPEKSLTLDSSRGIFRMVTLCAASGISIYSPHSALDAIKDGPNDFVANILATSTGIASLVPIAPASAPYEGCGVGRLLTLSTPTSLQELARRWSTNPENSNNYLRIALPTDMTINSTVSTIAICVGSGASILSKVQADLYFTGEMSHHEILKAITANKSAVLLTEHSNCERGYLKEILQPKLALLLNSSSPCPIEYNVLVSEKDKDPLSLVKL